MNKDAETALEEWSQRYENIKQKTFEHGIVENEFEVEGNDFQFVFAHDKEYEQIHITTKDSYDKDPSFYDTFHCMLDSFDGEDETITLWTNWKEMAKEFEAAGLYPEPDSEAQWDFQGEPEDLEKMLTFLRNHNRFTELEFSM